MYVYYLKVVCRCRELLELSFKPKFIQIGLCVLELHYFEYEILVFSGWDKCCPIDHKCPYLSKSNRVEPLEGVLK